MDEKERAALIRKGNAAFNEGDIKLAIKIYKATGYKDGLIRLGDYFFYEKEQPLVAYGYYRLAGHEQMINRLYEGFTFALNCWLHDEKNPAFPDAPAPAPKPKTKDDLIKKIDQAKGLSSAVQDILRKKIKEK